VTLHNALLIVIGWCKTEMQFLIGPAGLYQPVFRQSQGRFFEGHKMAAKVGPSKIHLI
jgi:hypothetical protein